MLQELVKWNGSGSLICLPMHTESCTPGIWNSELERLGTAPTDHFQGF